MRIWFISLALAGLWLSSCTAAPTPTLAPTAVVPATAVPSATAVPATATAPATAPAASTAAAITAANAASLQPGEPVPAPQIYQMTWTPDSQLLRVGNKEGLHTIASDGRGEINFINTQALTGTLSFAQDGTLAALQDLHTVRLYAPETLQLQQTIADFGTATNIILAPDAGKLAVQSADNIAVTLYDLPGGQPAATLTGFETAAPVYGVQFDANWQTMIWIARATVQLMDVDSGQLGPRFEHEDFVGALALSPDGRILATATSATLNGQFTPIIKLWNAQTGDAIATLPQPALITSLAFSPDGALLAAGTTDGSILFWDVQAQTMITTLDAPVEQVRQLAFSPDGRFLATADQEVILWHVPA
ncbi:MAG: hypothetical protein H6661_05925 [Ardenticatenaceae bacterium]|nr:hypothetical protein [Ardenticatenaceae bacterium]